MVKVLLQAGAALHDKDDEFGSNAFMWACGGGHSEVVRCGDSRVYYLFLRVCLCAYVRVHLCVCVCVCERVLIVSIDRALAG